MRLYIEYLIGVCMTSHTYRIGTDVRLQEDGAPAGLRFSCPMSRIVMSKWRKLMLEICRKNGFKTHLLAKYVDDSTNVVDRLKLGAVWDKLMNKIVISKVKTGSASDTYRTVVGTRML